METILTIGSGIFGGTTKDCGEPGVNHAITPDTDGIPNPNNPAEAAARMEDVSPNVKKVTVSGRARQLLDGSFGDVTTTARFDAGFRPHVSPANAPSVVRVEADLSVNWSRGAVGAGGVSLGVGFECPGMPAPLGVGIGADATVSGAASTKQTVKCVITSGNPFGFLAQINISGTAAAGAQSGKAQDMSYAGTFTVSVVPAGKELKGVSGPLETVAGVPFAQPFVVNVFRNDTDAAVSGEPIVFNLKNAAGTVVQTKAGITGPDGIASMNFTVADPGDYEVEAACAGCVAGSPVSFLVTVLSEAEATEIQVVRGNGDSGFFNERLPNGLTARIHNRFTDAPIAEVPVDFSMQPSQSCKGSQSFTARLTRSVPRTGLAHTDVTLGDQEATCTAIATCNPPGCMPTAKSAAFTFHVKRPPSQAIDNGAPGNPLSVGTGGPAPVGARRAAIPVDILFRVKTPLVDMPSPYRATRPPEDGYIGLLRGDEVGFKARAPLGSFLWSGYSTGVSDVLPDRPVTAPVAKAANPATLTLHRVEGGNDALVRILVREPPLNPAVLALLEIKLSVACIKIPNDDRIYEFLRNRTMGELGRTGRTMKSICGPYLDRHGNAELSLCDNLLQEYFNALKYASEDFEPRGRAKDRGCRNNCCDAAKHAYWHAAATTIIGSGFAEEFGIAHEVQSQCDGFDNEVVMDLHNNELGQSLAGPLDDNRGRVLAAIKSGSGLVLWDSENRKATSPLVSSALCGSL